MAAMRARGVGLSPTSSGAARGRMPPDATSPAKIGSTAFMYADRIRPRGNRTRMRYRPWVMVCGRCQPFNLAAREQLYSFRRGQPNRVVPRPFVAISIAPTKSGIVAGVSDHDRQRGRTAKLEDRDGVSRHERQFPRDVRLLFVWILRVAYLGGVLSNWR